MAFNVSLVNNSISFLQSFDGDHTIYTPSEAVYTLSEAEGLLLLFPPYGAVVIVPRA
jgi:hypothetical protein